MRRMRRPIRSRGKKTERWDRWMRWAQGVVERRARGTCEVPGCTEPATDFAHLFARMHLIPEPFASHPLLTRGLCRQHHNDIDRAVDIPLRERLRRQAFVEFRSEFAPTSWRPERGSTPLEAMRQLVDVLVAAGYGYDRSANAINQEWAA